MKLICYFATYLLTVLIISTAGFSAWAATSADEESRPEIDRTRGDGCLWGGLGEQTTYSTAYSPLMAPEIPVIQKKRDDQLDPIKYPMRPEEAITVTNSDGCRFLYYYKESVGYRKITEFRKVFEPVEQFENEPIQEIDPCTGQLVWRQVSVPVRSAFPVWHEKEFVRYEPAKVLVRVIIPETPSSSDSPQQGIGSAEAHFSTEIEPR